MSKEYLYNVCLIDNSCVTVKSLLPLPDVQNDINKFHDHDYDYYRIGDCIFRRGQIKTIRLMHVIEDEDE